MPAALRHEIRSSYYDYSIYHVTQVERKETTYYLVKMQNEDEYVTLKVIDGEISVYETLKKAK
jgi:hypothetical protein